MSDILLEVSDIRASAGDKEILKGVSLIIKKGEVHVLMGPNGAGKSTFANVIMAHPGYTVTKGSIFFEGADISRESADQRARRGIFMSFQQAVEIPGITLENFIRSSKAAVTGQNQPILKFRKQLYSYMDALDMKRAYAGRYLNVGFSGGEKKKSEILQMSALEPKLAILDETDSGLDVDAVKIVSEGVKRLLDGERSVLIITHHQRILQALAPDFVHVLVGGRILMDSGASLVEKIASEGYKWLSEEALV
ncbi:MAG: Fe-S cluster assembly ATPase SufC [Oscillospiraceae bacterium]|jgi:Fe-S cluster assembly ATP-binding protein|nr:Fe-S cluster assembly ATPase SufC [Oscillospiraceae bacterium]